MLAVLTLNLFGDDLWSVPRSVDRAQRQASVRPRLDNASGTGVAIGQSNGARGIRAFIFGALRTENDDSGKIRRV